MQKEARPGIGHFVRLLSRLSYRHPVAVLLCALLLAAAGGYIYFYHLPILTDRKQLINQELETNQVYQRYIDEFGDNEFIALVVGCENSGEFPATATAAQRRNMKALIADWSRKLRRHPEWFPQVIEKNDWQQWGPGALLYLPEPNLRALADFIGLHAAEIRSFVGEPSLEMVLKQLNNTLDAADAQTAERTKSQAAALFHLLNEVIGHLNKELSQPTLTDGLANALSLADLEPLFVGTQFDPEGYFFSQHGKVVTAFSRIQGNPSKQNRYKAMLEFAQDALEESLQALPDSLHIRAGLTGMPALEYEEIRTTRHDFARGATIAIFLITILFMLAFGNVIRPLLAAVCLLISIAVTFVFAWLAVGHLNVLALIFTVILVALGIDFAIHVLTHYELALSRGQAPDEAIENTRKSIGAPLWMGGLTTAVAFLSAVFTEFVGLAELGLIAGGGLVISILCMVLVYPAMLYLLDTRRPSASHLVPTPFTRLFSLPYRPGLQHPHRSKFLVAALLGITFFGYVHGQHNFNSNLLSMQAADGKAHYWQKVLIHSENNSLFAICTFSSREQLEKTRERFAAIPDIVKGTESLYPEHETQKRKLLQKPCDLLSGIEVSHPRAPSVFGVKRQIWTLRQRIRKFRRLSPQASKSLQKTEATLSRFYQLLGSSPENLLRQRMQEWQMLLLEKTAQVVQTLPTYLCPASLRQTEIPVFLKARYLGRHGSLALMVYPAKNVWESANLKEFVETTRSIYPNVVGEAVSLYENGTSLKRSFVQASIYSLVAIVALLLLWLRSLKRTALSLLPLFVGVGLLLLAMRLLPGGPIDWNFSNFFALPILIGIGVDSGIHLVKTWQQPGMTVFRNSAKAVLVSTLTTITGFAVLGTSSHLGIRSLGLVLSLGLAGILLISLTALPSCLKLLDPKD